MPKTATFVDKCTEQCWRRNKSKTSDKYLLETQCKWTLIFRNNSKKRNKINASENYQYVRICYVKLDKKSRYENLWEAMNSWKVPFSSILPMAKACLKSQRKILATEKSYVDGINLFCVEYQNKIIDSVLIFLSTLKQFHVFSQQFFLSALRIIFVLCFLCMSFDKHAQTMLGEQRFLLKGLCYFSLCTTLLKNK